MSLVGILVLMEILNRLEEKYFLSHLFALALTLFFLTTICSHAYTISALEFEIGVKPGDWIEYQIDWIVPPSYAESYPIRTKREITDLDGATVTMIITLEMSNGSVSEKTEEGNIESGTGAAAMIFIPANLEAGDQVSIQGFDDVRIISESRGVYLEIERVVLFANFSDMGFDISIFWDKEKGTALEITSSHSTLGVKTTKIAATNLLSFEPSDDNPVGFETLVFMVFSIAMLLTLLLYVRLRRRKKRRKKKRSSI